MINSTHPAYQDGADMSASFVQTYRAFAHNNAWANHRLLTACANLNQEAFEAERTGFFPSLQKTLNHIYIVDLFIVDALEGGWLGPKAFANRVPCPSLAELRRAQASVPAPDPPSRAGARDAFGDRHRTASTRRVLSDRGSTAAGHRVRQSWLDRRNGVGTVTRPAGDVREATE